MVISYQSELEDVAEPQVRMYLRTKTAGDARLIQTLSAWIYGTIPLGLLSFFLHSQVYLLLGTIFGFGCALFTYFYFRKAVKKRTVKYLKREYGSVLSSESVYTLKPPLIEYASRGVTISFNLNDLTSVTEDEVSLELKFEKKGLCVIPLRAFKSVEEKNHFRAELKSGKPDELSPT